MLLALVLAACVTPAAHEWVEISQTHYRKPTLSSNPGDRLFYPTNVETTEDTRINFHSVHDEITNKDRRYRPHRRPIEDQGDFVQNVKDGTMYSNLSITEHKWLQNEHRTANIKRFNTDASIRANITPEFSLEVFGEVTEHVPELLTDQEVVSATIERVPNKGSVKRVQITNTPVKSQSINKMNPLRNNVKQYGVGSTESDLSDEFEIKADIFKDIHSDVTDNTNNIRRVLINQETPVWKYDRTTTVWPVTEATMTFKTHIRPKTVASENNTRNKTNVIQIRNYSTPADRRLSEGNIQTNNLNIRLENIEENKKGYKEETKYVAKTNEINTPKEIDVEQITIKPDSTNNRNVNNKGHETVNTKLNKAKPNVNKNEKESEKVTNYGVKSNTMENIIKILKVVTETISKNSRRGVNGKVKYLEDLKDTLLYSIKDRIDATWPDDGAGAGRPRPQRSARSAQARGHVQFPSSESSLMTISFLTFAVFLIKLVLQVIQTYKHKTMMVAPLVVATAGRKLRDFH